MEIVFFNIINYTLLTDVTQGASKFHRNRCNLELEEPCVTSVIN
jgi:hypothetical protein